LKEKLEDIGYPELINRVYQKPDYQRTKDVFLTVETWEKLVAGGFIHIYPLQTINGQWCRCNVPMCTYGKTINMDVNKCLDSPWGTGREIPMPVHYNRSTMPPGPHMMYFDMNGRKFKFYNWFRCLRDLMEHYIVAHLAVKPYFGCPYSKCYQPLDEGKTDVLADPCHGWTNPHDERWDSCWYKKQNLLKKHFIKVHGCKFAQLGCYALDREYREQVQVGPVMVCIAKDPPVCLYHLRHKIFFHSRFGPTT
jgi:hypothetical protein